MTRDYDTIHTVRDCGITGGKEFGETAGGLTCVRQIETGLSGCVCNEEGYKWGRESSCEGPRCRSYRVEGGGVGGCGEVRFYVKNMTVGGVGVGSNRYGGAIGGCGAGGCRIGGNGVGSRRVEVRGVEAIVWRDVVLGEVVR